MLNILIGKGSGCQFEGNSKRGLNKRQMETLIPDPIVCSPQNQEHAGVAFALFEQGSAQANDRGHDPVDAFRGFLFGGFEVSRRVGFNGHVCLSGVPMPSRCLTLGTSDGARFRPTSAVPPQGTAGAIFTLWMPDEPMILSKIGKIAPLRM